MSNGAVPDNRIERLVSGRRMIGHRKLKGGYYKFTSSLRHQTPADTYVQLSDSLYISDLTNV